MLHLIFEGIAEVPTNWEVRGLYNRVKFRLIASLARYYIEVRFEVVGTKHYSS